MIGYYYDNKNKMLP